ncbi:MAG: domain S-box [Bacteroidetes bacterium]|nr:domain S-box [Bacteroidota bacterium]
MFGNKIKRMKPGATLFKLINLGINKDQSIEVATRLKIINQFNLLCISYSIPYILFSLSQGFYKPALVFFVGLLLYMVSLYSNKNGNYNVAKFLILIATNYSVFYLSLFYGFASGFHLYYFTSPWIVFSLFNFSEVYKILVGIFLYLLSIVVLVLVNHYDLISSHETHFKIASVLYDINVFLALSFCLLLVANFSNFNKHINKILLRSNEELETKQELLENEIIERKSTETKLQTLLKEKEILLSETHHRVKNNLAVVSGMLDLQVLMSDEEKVATILNDSRNRIKSMSLIHEALYKFDNVSQIEFGRYIRTLVEEIKQTYVSESLSVNMVYDLDNVYLDLNKAIPCGLLVNEVLTNAFKHAFKGRSDGEIKIVVKQEGTNCLLEIGDNGNGIGSGQTSSQSIGMTLINAFVKQLKGKLEVLNDGGTTFRLIFDLEMI